MSISKALSFIKKRNSKRGFSLIEAVLAVSLFSLVLLALISAIIYGRESIALSGIRSRALLIAEEGQESLRNLRDEKFANLPDGTYGLATSSNQWILSGTSDVTDIFTRQIQIGAVNGHIKIATTTVTWQAKEGRSGQIALTSYLTQWRRERGGMLVYADRVTVNDRISYRLLDPDTLTWELVSSTADVDPASTSKAPRAVQIYSSATRTEKVMLSRHYDGARQYIYAQVWNGASWGNVVPLSNWAGTNGTRYLDVQNFSGTYLASGDFMVVYSDDTTTPKFRIWNGSTWSLAGISMPNLSANGSGIPNFIVAKARPGTNEVMAAFFDQSSDANTMHFNGGSYITGSWILHPRHSAVAPVNTKRLVDFDWSPNNPLVGGLVFSNSNTDVSLNIKIWTAKGFGSGSWTTAVVNTTNQARRLGAVNIIGRPGANEFIACDKDANATPRIICYESNFTPAWSNPANQIIINTPPGTDTGIQKSYDISFESQTGNTALGVYSDSSAIPKLKKYDTLGNLWDASPTNLNAIGGILETVRLVPDLNTDDILILLANTNQDLYSVVWNGTNDNLYSTPAGKAFSSHGVSGSSDMDYWYDFAWDKF